MKRPWSRKFWHRYVAFASVLGGASAAIDVPLHAWPQLGISLGATGVTLLASRTGFRAAAHREAHKLDYAKIARLEIELGLVPPPPVKAPDPPPVPNRNAMLGPVTAAPPVLYKPRGFCSRCGNWNDQPHAAWCRNYVAPPPPEMRAPDQCCALCIPGGPPPGHGCPFYPVCQQRGRHHR